jgi:RNA polymerase sigma factor (sigma-70 family)
VSEELTHEFERERPRLHAVAYRMLGSHAEAEDAVQEAWVRLNRADGAEIRNLRGWLTTVVGRISLDLLRTRTARRETPLDETVVTEWPEPGNGAGQGLDPEQEALLAESVGVALVLVLDALTPAERLAFVLHDLFGVPFAEIGQILDRSTDAAKMLASRARRRVRRASPPATDLARQRRVVEAFRAAARDGDFDALIALLAPDVEVVADSDALLPGAPLRARGAERVARQTRSFRPLAPHSRVVLVNGGPGVLVRRQGAAPTAVLAFTIRGLTITRIDIVTDPDRLSRIDLSRIHLSRTD